MRNYNNNEKKKEKRKKINRMILMRVIHWSLSKLKI